MNGRLQLARVRSDEQVAPFLAIACDGVLYDLAAAEEFFAPGRASVGGDFFQRVVSMRCDGLLAVADRLRAGRRPTEARLWSERLCSLVPVDTRRSVYVQTVLPGEQGLAQRRDARALLGDRWPVPFPQGTATPAAEVGLALLLGEDLHQATSEEAGRAVLGLGLVLDWASSEQRWQRPSCDVPSQIGGHLLCGIPMTELAGWAVEVCLADSGGSVRCLLVPARLCEALAAVSRQHRLLAGDVVGVRLSSWLRPSWKEGLSTALVDAAGSRWLSLEGYALEGG